MRPFSSRAARAWLCALAVLAACEEPPEPSPESSDAGSAGAAASAGARAVNAGGAGSRAVDAGGAGASGAAGSRAGSGGASGGSGQAGSNRRDAAVSADSGPDSSQPMMPVATGCNEEGGSAPPATWVNATGNLAGLASECGNLTLVAADPCSERVIAGVAKSGLWASSDRGASWKKLGGGAGSAEIVHRPASIVFDPEHPEVFYESGIYGTLGDGVFKTRDSGASFEQLGTIGHIDLVAVDFSDPERKTLLAGVHETKQKLFLSRDGGKSWNDIGPKLPAGSHFSSAPLVLDAQRFLLGACGWGDGTCGVFASGDGGEHWQQTSMETPSGAPLWTRAGQMVWPTIYGSGAIISDDSGQSWTKVGGPRGSPVELPDGRLAAVGGDHLVISSDHGTTWSNIGEPLPYAAAGLSYSPSARSFFIWHNDCKEAVLPDAVMRAGWGG